MVTALSILFFLVCLILCLYAFVHSSNVDMEKRDKEFREKLSKRLSENPSICVEIDGSRIMLRKEFIEKEWNKTDEKDIPVRGQYEPAIHFMNRVKKYRERMKELKKK